MPQKQPTSTTRFGHVSPNYLEYTISRSFIIKVGNAPISFTISANILCIKPYSMYRWEWIGTKHDSDIVRKSLLKVMPVISERVTRTLNRNPHISPEEILFM